MADWERVPESTVCASAKYLESNLFSLVPQSGAETHPEQDGAEKDNVCALLTPAQQPAWSLHSDERVVPPALPARSAAEQDGSV